MSEKEERSSEKSNLPFEDLLSGRGTPALMSLKEPALRMLKERYSESFALTQGIKQSQIHLFMIKTGMWALVWTFTPKDSPEPSIDRGKFGLDEALHVIEEAMLGKNKGMLEKLDRGVSNALERIRVKTNEFKVRS